VVLGEVGLPPAGEVAGVAESERTVMAAGPTLRLPKGARPGKGSAPQPTLSRVKSAVAQPYVNQTQQQLEKSRRSYQDLIREHEQKLADYRKDPAAQDHNGVLRKAPPHLKQKIVDGRIKELEGQLAKQRGELRKIEDAMRALPRGR
jgi:hypothetical protein